MGNDFSCDTCRRACAVAGDATTESPPAPTASAPGESQQTSGTPRIVWKQLPAQAHSSASLGEQQEAKKDASDAPSTMSSPVSTEPAAGKVVPTESKMTQLPSEDQTQLPSEGEAPHTHPRSTSQRCHVLQFEESGGSPVRAKSHASLRDKFDMIISYRSEIKAEMLRIAHSLRSRFGLNCVVHGLMCKPGDPWDAGYFSWLEKAKVVLILLSPEYFRSATCRKESKRACTLIDPLDQEKAVIPVVVTALPWKYPGGDPCGSCSPELQAELGFRNCFPNPDDGVLMDNFEANMSKLIEIVSPHLGVEVSEHSSLRQLSHGSLQQPSPESVPVRTDLDLCVVVQFPPVAFQPASAENTRNRMCLERIRSHLDSDGSGLPLRVCLLSGHTSQMLAQLNADRANPIKCVVWCAMGFDIRPELQPSTLFTMGTMPERWPLLIIVCMKYGARMAAEQIHQAGAPAVIWFAADAFSDGERNDLLTCELPEYAVDILQQEGTIANRVASSETSCMCRNYPVHGLFPEQCSATLPPIHNKEQHLIDMIPEPLLRNRGFHRDAILDGIKLLQVRDMPLLNKARDAVCSKAHPCVSLESEDETQRDRCRSIAMHVCQFHLEQTYFQAVLRVASIPDVQIAKETLEETNRRMLLWIDTLDEEILGVIERWLGKGKMPVHLLFCTSGGKQEDFLDAMEFKPLRKVSAKGTSILASCLHEELRIYIQPTAQGPIKDGKAQQPCLSILDLFTVEERPNCINKVEAALNEVLPGDCELLGLYEGDYHGLLVRICLADVAYLYEVRDDVLGGQFETRLSKLLPTIQEAGYTLRCDKSKFMASYASISLQYDKLTPHQEDVMDICKKHIAAKEAVHCESVAGAGKTFFAVHVILILLGVTNPSNPSSSQPRALFVANTRALCCHVVNWICQRYSHSRKQRRQMLERLHLLFPPLTEGPQVIDIKHLEAEQKVKVTGVSDIDTYNLVVIDEAHITSVDTTSRDLIQQYIGPGTALLVLSDISQSRSGRDMFLPSLPGASSISQKVHLTEVVRSSKRICTAALAFQLGEDKLETCCFHDSIGPPLKPFLFKCDGEGDRFRQYAQKTLQALEYVLWEYSCQGDLSVLHDRVAIVVPDGDFRRRLEDFLRAETQDRFTFIRASDAAEIVSFNSKCDVQVPCVVLEEIDNFDGLERLIVMAVGLDAIIHKSGGSVGEAVIDVMEVRSRLFRAITRANMMTIVVNEILHGGWLEFLGHIEFVDEEFSADREKERYNQAAADVQSNAEEERNTKERYKKAEEEHRKAEEERRWAEEERRKEHKKTEEETIENVKLGEGVAVGMAEEAAEGVAEGVAGEAAARPAILRRELEDEHPSAQLNALETASKNDGIEPAEDTEVSADDHAHAIVSKHVDTTNSIPITEDGEGSAEGGEADQATNVECEKRKAIPKIPQGEWDVRDIEEIENTVYEAPSFMPFTPLVRDLIDGLFRQIDRDRRGFIEMRELAELIDVLRRGWPTQDCDMLIQLLDPRGEGKVLRNGFRNFIPSALEKAFGKLAGGSRILDLRDLERLSRALDMDHRDAIRELGDRESMDCDGFVEWVVENVLKLALKGRQVVAGLGKILALGGDYSSHSPLPSEFDRMAQDCFDRVDQDRCGYIDLRELAELSDNVRQGCSRQDSEVLMDPTDDRKVYPRDFRNFIRSALEKCFDKLSRGSCTLALRDLEPVSRVLDVDHTDTIREFGDRESVHFVQFVGWVVNVLCGRGLEGRQFIAALAKIFRTSSGYKVSDFETFGNAQYHGDAASHMHITAENEMGYTLNGRMYFPESMPLYSDGDLEEIERQVREPDSLLEDYRREIEHPAQRFAQVDVHRLWENKCKVREERVITRGDTFDFESGSRSGARFGFNDARPSRSKYNTLDFDTPDGPRRSREDTLDFAMREGGRLGTEGAPPRSGTATPRPQNPLGREDGPGGSTGFDFDVDRSRRSHDDAQFHFDTPDRPRGSRNGTFDFESGSRSGSRFGFSTSRSKGNTLEFDTPDRPRRS